MSRSRSAGSLLAVATAVMCLAQPLAAQAQAVPLVASADARPVTTRVMAIGSLTAKATPEDLRSVLEREVPATLKLYLAGHIDDWYARTDRNGVVFILNVTTVAEARALLDPLPLGRAGMMTFEFTPLGPLRPLAKLLPRSDK